MNPFSIPKNTMASVMRLSRGMTPEARKRANARSYAKVYRKRGLIQKGPCEVCGSNDVEAHHEDYDKPTDVRWVCKPHHKLITLGKIDLKPRVPQPD